MSISFKYVWHNLQILNHRDSLQYWTMNEWINQKLISLFIFTMNRVLRDVWQNFEDIVFCYWHLCICCMTLRENILGNFITNHIHGNFFRDVWKYWKNRLFVHENWVIFGMLDGRSGFEEIEFFGMNFSDRLMFGGLLWCFLSSTIKNCIKL